MYTPQLRKKTGAMKTMISIKRPLRWAALALLLSPSACIPDWLDNIITAPAIAPSPTKPDNSSTGITITNSTTSNSSSRSTPPSTTNSDTGSEHDSYIDEPPAGAWTTHARTNLSFDADFPRQRQVDNGYEPRQVNDYEYDDEFTLPDDAFEQEVAVPSQTIPQNVLQTVPQIVPRNVLPTAVPQTVVVMQTVLQTVPWSVLETIDEEPEEPDASESESESESSVWMAQLAQFATTAILALCGFYDGPQREGCGGGGVGVGGGGGGPGIRGDAVGRRGAIRDTGDNAGPSGGNNGNDSDNDSSIFDHVGDAFNGLLSGLGRGMMNALGFEDRDEKDDPLPDSTEGRIARWRAYSMSWRAQDDGTRGDDGSDSKKKDRDTLWWDMRRLSENCNVKAMIQRIIGKFLESYPSIGYTQGFEYACKAILTAVGNDERASVELFKVWAAAAGRVVSDEKTTRKVARYSFYKCSPAMRELLVDDEIIGVKGTGKTDRAAALYFHLFHRSISSMCSRLEFPEPVQAVIIDKTLKAGIHGVGVSAWVITALLSIAEKDAELTQDINLRKIQMCEAAAERVTSFSDLEEAAHTTFASFMRGYKKALG